jgi:uncharacterized protein (TIGR03083 family)
MATMHDSIWQCSEEIARLAAQADLSLRVPSCPDWTLGDLVMHLGSVQSFWAANLLARNSAAPLRSGSQRADPTDDALLQWFRDCTKSLRNALREVGNDSPCWTWWGDPLTSGAVGRHQVQEAAVHCWDAQLTTGDPKPVAAEIALDGVSEFLEVHGDELEVAPGESVLLTATDSGGRWRVGGDAPFAAEVSATTSELVLLLHGRIALSAVRVDGATSSLQRFLDSPDLL